MYGSLKLGYQEQRPNGVVPCSLRDFFVEFQFVDKCLDRPHIGGTLGHQKSTWQFFTDAKPLLSVATQFFGMELAPSWMCIVVKLDLGMTLKAYWDGIINGTGPIVSYRINVV